jgi:putative acetyltransferase
MIISGSSSKAASTSSKNEQAKTVADIDGEAMNVLRLLIEDPDSPEVRALLEASDAYAASRYPAESNHMLDLQALRRPGVTFVVARLDGHAVGCGAIVHSGEDWVEIKRMFVDPAARGQQVGRRLLEKLEEIAREGGATALRLETGIKQPEAIGLYRSCGFVEIAPFADYQPDPLSMFMEKR